MYLDPGFGSMIIQMVVAGIAACGAVLFMLKAKIKAWWLRRKGINPEETDAASDAEKENEQETQLDGKDQ